MVGCFLIPSSGSSQGFFNGSFEDNNATTCLYNITNSYFDSLVNYTKGIGNIDGLDIFLNGSCTQLRGPAQDGNYYISLEIGFSASQYTAISMMLTDTLYAGSQYSFSYFDKEYYGFNADTVEIGLSNNPDSLGDLIYISPLPDTSWNRRIVTFIAPLNGKYITAKARTGHIHFGTFIDNFSFDTSTVSVNETSNKETRVVVYPNPSKSIFTFRVSDELKEIEILNLLGDKIILSTKKEIDLYEFADGIYFFHLITQKGNNYFGKLIKQ